MKQTRTLLILIFAASIAGANSKQVLAQTAKDAAAAKNKVLSAADLKSGTSQDVLISFFQLAAENLTGDAKSFKFQSSLFAIKAKTNDDLWIDYNYLKEKFARNFSILVNPELDAKLKFKSNTLGLKYAIVNNRDKTVFDFSRPSDLDYLTIQREAIEEYHKLVPDINDSRYLAALNFFATEDGKKLTAEKDLPEEFRKILRAKIPANAQYKNLTLEAFRDYLSNQYKRLALYVENRGLWTVEGNFSSLADGKLFSGISITSEYLKGMLKQNSKMNLELNLKGKLDFSDDTSTKLTTAPDRQVFRFAGGFNWIIAKNSNLKPVIELKGNITYNTVLRGRYINEQQNMLTANGTLRFRITDDFWIPFDIQYDPENGKVFGLLSVKFNFSGMTNAKK